MILSACPLRYFLIRARTRRFYLWTQIKSNPEVRIHLQHHAFFSVEGLVLWQAEHLQSALEKFFLDAHGKEDLFEVCLDTFLLLSTRGTSHVVGAHAEDVERFQQADMGRYRVYR